MRVQGMPQRFWIVTAPTTESAFDDICFECDFGRLLQQVRGGLREEDIVAIVLDGSEAATIARELLAARGDT